MTPISMWYIRTAWVWLGAAWVTGAGLALASLGWISWRVGLMHPALYHMLMVGWATQLIWGVAIWLFPIHTREHPRGNERQLWLGYTALNSGLVLRCICEPLLNLFPDWRFPGWSIRAGLVLSSLLMIVAIWLVGLNLWPRIKPKGGR